MTNKTQPTAHAEITAPISADLRRIDDAGAQPAPAEQLAAAASTLARLGYTYRGGAEWAPPIGRAPDFNLLDTANNRIAELEAESSQLQGSLDAQRMITDRVIALGKESDTKLSATQAEAKHWRSNHDNVVARLRIFTQRPDIPKELADRLPWYRELVRLQEVEAQAVRAAAPLPAVELVGIKDGQETSLGQVAMPPTMKARDLLREYGFSDFEDDVSQGAYALWAMESLIEYCQRYYAAAQPARDCLQQSPKNESLARELLLLANVQDERYPNFRAVALEAAAALQAAPPAPAAVAVPAPLAAGMKVAADLVQEQADLYIAEHAETDPDTGAVIWHHRDYGFDWHNGLEELAQKLLARAALAAAPAQAVAVPAEVELPDVEDMAHSAVQEALSFGVNHDVFHRWMRAVMDKTVQALAAAPAQEHATQLAGQGGTADAHAAWSAFEKLESDRGAAEPQSNLVRDYLMRAARVGIYRAAAPAQAQEDARDAARYRYWRQWWSHEDSETAQLPKTVEQMLEELDIDSAFDAAIDAARAAQGGAL